MAFFAKRAAGSDTPSFLEPDRNLLHRDRQQCCLGLTQFMPAPSNRVDVHAARRIVGF